MNVVIDAIFVGVQHPDPDQQLPVSLLTVYHIITVPITFVFHSCIRVVTFLNIHETVKLLLCRQILALDMIYGKVFGICRSSAYLRKA